MGSLHPADAAEEDIARPPAGHFDLSPLGHPMWWLALALLLVNDNLLKGAGLVPTWLTGKLSDFAFLMVAPVLLTTLLPVRLRARRIFAFSAVSIVFVAADLSPVASDAIVAMARRLGMRWRLWPDGTDLLALAVLPASWWVAGSISWLADHANRRWLQKVGVVLGAAACLATSAPPSWPHYPFFVNHTAQAQSVTFTWLLRKVDCNADLNQVAAGLSSGELGDAHVASLTAGQSRRSTCRQPVRRAWVGSARIRIPASPGATIARRCW